MSQNNITSISQFQQKSIDAAVTLDSVKAAINAWRETKKSASEKMPTILWDQIHALLHSHNPLLARWVPLWFPKIGRG